MATPLYCSNLNNLVVFSDFTEDDLWLSHDDPGPIDPALYDKGFLIITPQRLIDAIVAHGANAVAEIKAELVPPGYSTDVTVYVGQVNDTFSPDTSVDSPIEATPGDTFNLTTEFVVNFPGAWSYTPADPPVATFISVVNGGALTPLSLYSGSGGSFNRALERPVAFDTGTYPSNMTLQQAGDYFLLVTEIPLEDAHWSMGNNKFLGQGLVKANAIMDKYVIPCLASPDPFWLPANRTYEFPVDKTVSSFVIDREYGELTPDSVYTTQAFFEGSALLAFYESALGMTLVDGQLFENVGFPGTYVQFRLIPAAPPGHAYILRSDNIIHSPSTGELDASFWVLDLNISANTLGTVRYLEGSWGPTITAAPPPAWRTSKDGFYVNSPQLPVDGNVSKIFYTGQERVLAVGYNEIGSTFEHPLKRGKIQLDLVNLSDPGEPEYPIEESLPIDIETTIDPGEAISGFASLLRGEDANLVLNSLNSTMTAYLPFLVDKTDGIARDRPLDLNGQKVTGLSDAEFSEDAITVSQLQALL